MILVLSVAGLLVVWGSAILPVRQGPGNPEAGAISGAGLPRFVAAMLALPPLLIGLVLVGFRPLNSGGDTERYLYTYQHLTSVGSAYQIGHELYGNTEVLFWRVQALMKPVLQGEHSWLVANFLIVAILSWFAYRSLLHGSGVSSWLFSVAFLTYFLVYAGNGMRQAYEIPLGVLSLALFYRRRYVPALGAAVVATTFHWSALLLIGAVPVAILPKRRWIYLALPAAALGLHSFVNAALQMIVPHLGSSLQDRYNLYFVRGASTTISNPWSSVNLWVCILIYVLFMLGCNFEEPLERRLSQYQLLFMTMVMATLDTPEVWTRSMVNLLFVLPVVMAVVLLRRRWPEKSRDLFFGGFFIVMFSSIYLSSSARITLGI